MAQEQLQQLIRRKLVEIALLAGAAGEHDVDVRDSKDPQGSALTVTARQRHDFTAAIKIHDLDVI